MSVKLLVLECPVCGPKSRIEIAAAAYAGGWCVGVGLGRHKPRDFKVVDGTVMPVGRPPKAHACQGCGADFPKRRGRYPKLCDECKVAA